MLILDNRTLLLVTALMSIGSAIALIALWRAQTKRNGAGLWAIGTSSIALASILISGRGIIPDFFSSAVANSLFVFGFILISRGLRIFTRQPVLNYLDVPLATFCMLGFYYFNDIAAHLNIRIIILSGAFIIICTTTILTMIRNKQPSSRAASLAVASVFAVFGIAHGSRGAVALFHSFEHSFMHPSVTSSLVFLIGIFAIGGIAITLILLTYDELATELRIVSQAVEQSASSVIITDTKGVIEYVNPAFTATTGYEKAEVIGQNPRILRSDETAPEHYQALWSALAAGKTWRGEFHNQKKNGDLFWEIASIAPVKQRNGVVSHFVALKEDITALKKAEARILHMANHDILTGLPTRRLATDRLQSILAMAKRNQTKAAVMFVDIDGFKSVNDALGHDIGDEVLKETATRLSATLRKVDTVARIGGDEFWVLLSNVATKCAAITVAENIIHALASPYHIAAHKVHISASVGISLYPDHANSATDLIQRADQAMYEIKRQGKNNFGFASDDFTPS